jgi:hypothetical protein
MLPLHGPRHAGYILGERKKSIRFKALQVLHFASEFMDQMTPAKCSRPVTLMGATTHHLPLRNCVELPALYREDSETVALFLYPDYIGEA